MQFFRLKKFKDKNPKSHIFLLKFFLFKKIAFTAPRNLWKRFILINHALKKIRSPKCSIREIVEGLEMGLMFAQMKYFVPTSAAPAPVARWRCPRAAALASSLPTPSRVH